MSTPNLTRRHALGLAVSAAAAATVRPARAQSPLVVRVAYADIGVGNRPFVGGSSAATAHAAHYLEDEFANDPGVRIEWSFFKGAGPAVNEALASGQTDFALHGDLPSVIGRSNGIRTRLLLASGAHQPTYLAVPAGSDIRGVDDLKGRKVAMFRGTNLQLATAKVLAAHGLAERDLKVINMDFATMSAALASKDVDAAFGSPIVLDLEAQGLAKVVYTTKGDNPAFERHAHIHVTEAFEAQHPEVTGRVVKAFVKAAHWSSLEENREALFELWAKSGIPAARFRADLEGETLLHRNAPLFDDFMLAQYKEQARMAKEYGLVRREVDTTGWFEPRHLDAALKELGLQDFWPRLDASGKPAAA